MSPIRAITLVDQVVEAIISAAAEGHILPGDRIVEASLASSLGVSRVPVREALRLLESQGIVNNIPHRGMRLMEVNPKRVHNILVVRASLEQLAAREISKFLRRDPASLAGLELAMASMQRATATQDGAEHARADIAFHRALITAAGNDVLLQTWESLARRLTIIFGLAALQKDLGRIYQEHVTLLTVLTHGNDREIDRAVKEHIIEQSEVDFESLIIERRRLAPVIANSQ